MADHGRDREHCEIERDGDHPEGALAPHQADHQRRHDIRLHPHQNIVHAFAAMAEGEHEGAEEERERDDPQER
ncbi:MAG: hypothetical protein K8F62_09050, partial [Pseudorhodoplanes sp.]|nr:hypothetical protein [Pseudorhodoplanes sp.]